MPALIMMHQWILTQRRMTQYFTGASQWGSGRVQSQNSDTITNGYNITVPVSNATISTNISIFLIVCMTSSLLKVKASSLATWSLDFLLWAITIVPTAPSGSSKASSWSFSTLIALTLGSKKYVKLLMNVIHLSTRSYEYDRRQDVNSWQRQLYDHVGLQARNSVTISFDEYQPKVTKYVNSLSKYYFSLIFFKLIFWQGPEQLYSPNRSNQRKNLMSFLIVIHMKAK